MIFAVLCCIHLNWFPMLLFCAMTDVHNFYKNLVSDTIGCVNIMYPAEAISVGKNTQRISQPAASLIVRPAFF